jgi:hypothetical protein
VKTVCCGRNHTLALTETLEVPARLEAFVCCFDSDVSVGRWWVGHSRAVVAQVLSWGDGSGGVLGHGDEIVCALPTKVTCDVSRVTCDVKR